MGVDLLRLCLGLSTSGVGLLPEKGPRRCWQTKAIGSCYKGDSRSHQITDGSSTREKEMWSDKEVTLVSVLKKSWVSDSSRSYKRDLT